MRREPVPAETALRDLLAGNGRFVAGEPDSPRRRPQDYQALSDAQYPIATLVSCADSRVAPEILFDVGVGDIFVVRVAGNVIGGTGVTVTGSIEFSILELAVSLVLVLGHSRCGAVQSAIKHIDAEDSLPGALNGLVALVKPAVTETKGLPGDALELAVRRNVERGVAWLEGLEPIVAPRVKAGTVKVVGAVYDLTTGQVTVIT